MSKFLPLLPIVALFIAFVWIVAGSRRNRLDEDEEIDEHAADLPQVPPPQIDFRRTHLFHD